MSPLPGMSAADPIRSGVIRCAAAEALGARFLVFNGIDFEAGFDAILL